MRKEDELNQTNITNRINEILDCGFRYANYKLRLKKNRRKIDSRKLDYMYLLERLKGEVTELEASIRCVQHPDDLERVAQEAGDVICFASMICDKTEALEEV